MTEPDFDEATLAMFKRSEARRIDEYVERFVRESNFIEGIEHTTSQHYSATWRFLRGEITIPAIVELVHYLQPDAVLRNQPQIPGVQVGGHIAPASGPQIEDMLKIILTMENPWQQHVEYEVLHPFTDGNGRSGRAIWLHRHYNNPELDPWAIVRGFLHSFYYQTLSEHPTRKLP